ncbi:hypothetical protein RB653_010404 [Dictyostelium firmibasis]|uniref:EGF-like domain-containing protein n=1 Tax=Dictyostelium firmibasis TaxID=79012 RepID=A0AAN7U1C4_9MYCE
MKNHKNIQIYFILLFSIICSVNSIDLVPEEVPFLKNIVQKSNYSALNVPNIETIICGNSIQGSGCDSNGNLVSLYFMSSTIQAFTWSDFAGFTKLYSLFITGVSVDQTFIYNPMPSIGYLTIHTNTILEIDKILPKYDYLSFNIGGVDNTNLTIKASYLKNVSSFGMNGKFCDIEIDGNQSDSKLASLSIKPLNIPDLSVFPILGTLTLILDNGFNQSSFKNIQYFNNIGYIGIGLVSSSLYNFPIEFSYINNPKWSTIYFSQGEWNSPSDYIDLSNNNQTYVSFNLQNAGKKFNINGNFPFSKLPTGTCRDFSVNNGNFSNLPNMVLFERTQVLSLKNSGIGGNLPSVNDTLQKSRFTQQVSLSGNKLTGVIDESWCSIILDVSNNQLSGPLPDCFYCYLQDPTYRNRLIGNNFSNYNTSATCTEEQISIYKIFIINSKAVLIGKNIGTSLTNIVTYPEIQFVTNNLNDSFTGNVITNSNSYDIIQVRLLVPGINFTLSVSGNPPQIDEIVQNNATFIIQGQYYSYDKSVINVTIGDNQCIIKSNTFYEIICDIDYPVVDYGNTSVLVIVDDKNSTFYIDLKYTPVKCNSTCLNGICNDRLGICNCSNGWTSDDCSIPKHEVTSSTKVSHGSGGEIILIGWFGNIHTGLQVLFDGVNSQITFINSSSISTKIGGGFGLVNTTVLQNNIIWNGLIDPYIQPLNGYCNYTTKLCTCDIKWTTVNFEVCTIPYHYVSSSSKVPSTTGGNITLSGWFGDVHEYLQLSIDNEYTAVQSIDNETITITIPPGIGSKNIQIIQNNITWTGLIYPYSESTIKCLNNCSGNGVCKSNGECKCNENYIGPDCKTKDVGSTLPPTDTHVNPDGSTSISNEDTIYLIYIDSISEMDFYNNQVPNTLVNLKNGWKINNTTNSATGVGSSITTFYQNINNATVTMTIENIESNNGKEFTFAGNQFTVSKDGFKLSLSVSNWNYKSNLNTLQIQMSSDVSLNEGSKINECIDSDSQSTNIETSSNSNDLQNVNYLKISKNGKTLYGRFQDKILSDGRPTTTITKVISKDDKKVVISLDLPHCNQCLLDPDFSVIINPDFKSSDSCGKENKKPWLIPVAVTVPVVGCALAVSAFMLTKKIRSNNKFLNKFGGKNQK